MVKGETTFTFVTGGIDSAITQGFGNPATITAALAGLALIALFGWQPPSAAAAP